jgi:hypothetical protein
MGCVYGPMFGLPEGYKRIRMETEYCSCNQWNLRNAHFALLYVFTLLFPCCDACYDFRIKTTFGSAQLPFLCRRCHDLLCGLCLFARRGVQHVVTLWVICRVSCKKQGMLTLREYLGPSPKFWWFRVAHLFSFLCCVCVSFVFCLCLNIDSNVAHVSQLTILDVPFDFL